MTIPSSVDGRVLVVGGEIIGRDAGGTFTTTAEVWDPASGTFSPAGSVAQRRDYATATLLPDGRVLIVGGCIGDQCEGGSVDEAEIWDPATSSFSPAGSLSEPGGGSATLLPDGRVLIVGGETAEVWAPSSE